MRALADRRDRGRARADGGTLGVAVRIVAAIFGARNRRIAWALGRRFVARDRQQANDEKELHCTMTFVAENTSEAGHHIGWFAKLSVTITLVIVVG